VPKLARHQPTRERVAKNLKRLLKEKGVVIKALAKDSDVKRSAIYRIKSAKTGVGIDVLGRLAAGFGIDVAEFFLK
jgi:transcriptional regulator with XRE-family HTH domain